MSLLERVIQTSRGPVFVWAELDENGTTLHVTQAAFYSVSGKKLNLGVRGILELRRELASDLAELGYTQLRVAAMRVSGASPNRTTSVVIDLTEERYGRGKPAEEA